MNNCRLDLTYICARNVAAGIKIDADELAESAGIVVLHSLGVAEGLQNGIGLEQLLLQFTLHNTNSEHISISAISISAIAISAIAISAIALSAIAISAIAISAISISAIPISAISISAISISAIAISAISISALEEACRQYDMTNMQG